MVYYDASLNQHHRHILNFSNTYNQLGDAFYQRVLPTPVAEPQLLFWNEQLAKRLDIRAAPGDDPDLLANYFSGNQLPEGADSIALAYCGHQFGHLSPQLGDGRAHLLGELIDINGERVDIQLKGSGQTAFSRQGDGRCALGPAVREFVMSEAMHYLGVPTTRSLAVVASGEAVYRNGPTPGAIVTRIASSHIRVGTFQYFAIRGAFDSLQILLDYAINRHFPDVNKSMENKACTFLERVIEKQIELIVHWMRVGFIHGVMNTDNVAISGETIDFGPCAMMGVYHPETVYSSIDTQGRYAFGNQPNITLWNMLRLAECLLPLINEDQDQAIAQVEPLLQQFNSKFDQAYFNMLANKLGLASLNENDSGEMFRKLIEELLLTMKENKLDYTQTFTLLTQTLDHKNLERKDIEPLGNWIEKWQKQLRAMDIDIPDAKKRMEKNNPLVIPRNHHVEAVLAACEEQGKTQPAEELLAVLRSPYKETPLTGKYQAPPLDSDLNYRTFCGT